MPNFQQQRRWLPWVAAASLVVLLAGGYAVSSIGTTAEAPVNVTTKATLPNVVTSTTPPSPARAVTLTRGQAAQRYLEIVKPSNDVIGEPKCKQIVEFYADGGSWPPNDQPTWDERPHRVMAECYKRLVPLYEKSIKAFQTTSWPTDALTDMADLISLSQAQLHCNKQVAQAASGDAMDKALACHAPDDGSADRVRARFGLPGRNA